LTAGEVVEIISGQPFLFLSYTINLLTVRSGVESGTTINPGNEIFIPEDHSLVTRRQISSTSTLPSRNMWSSLFFLRDLEIAREVEEEIVCNRW